VLDEIDQLDSKRQSVLYTIFEWPALPGSRLVLVGVANALDLTERALPRLQARCSLRPRTLHFAPYTKQQIINIFTKILGDTDSTNVFSPVALQMLAGIHLFYICFRGSILMAYGKMTTFDLVFH
jgi:cell division control protein 6